MINCLILGGNGFLGRNLCQTLLSCGKYRVIIYNRWSSRLDEFAQIFPSVKIITGNFEQENNFETILESIDVVFHLISTTNPSNTNMLPEFNSNVVPTIKFLNICTKYKIKLIFFSSGGTVYGIPSYIPIDEDHATNPISTYGIQKLTIENCIKYYGYAYGLDYLILRISNPYGIYQNPQNNQGVVAVFLSRILMNENIEIWGDGSNIRDYIFINDLMDLCKQIIQYRGRVKVFNVGSGRGHSVNEIIEIMQKVTECKALVKYIPKRIQDVPINVLNIGLINHELHWSPVVNFEEGIKRMCLAWDSSKKVFIENGAN